MNAHGGARGQDDLASRRSNADDEHGRILGATELVDTGVHRLHESSALRQVLDAPGHRDVGERRHTLSVELTRRDEMTVNRYEGLAIAIALLIVGRLLVMVLKALVE